MSKLYTGRGDSGETDLFSGTRVGKDSRRVAAYGCVDELNSHLGLALAGCAVEAIRRPLVDVQNHLFDLGGELATPAATTRSNPAAAIHDQHVETLERYIDAACADVDALRQFILPGGCELAARLHVARTVCRRTEREVVALSRVEPVRAQIVVYLNRLSDLLFALARAANAAAGVDDVPWRKQD